MVEGDGSRDGQSNLVEARGFEYTFSIKSMGGVTLVGNVDLGSSTHIKGLRERNRFLVGLRVRGELSIGVKVSQNNATVHYRRRCDRSVFERGVLISSVETNLIQIR